MYYLIDSNKSRRADVRQEFDTWREVRDEVISILESYALATSHGRQTVQRKALIADLYSEADDFRSGIVRVSDGVSYSTTIGNQYIAVGMVETAGQPVVEEIKRGREFWHKRAITPYGTPERYRVTRVDRHSDGRVSTVYYRAVGDDGKTVGTRWWAYTDDFLSKTIAGWVA